MIKIEIKNRFTGSIIFEYSKVLLITLSLYNNPLIKSWLRTPSRC